MEQSKRHAQANCTCAIGGDKMNFSSVLGNLGRETCLSSYQKYKKDWGTALRSKSLPRKLCFLEKTDKQQAE